jgi:hypothetical protein
MFHMYDMFSLSSISYVRKRAMGRKKLWAERITLPLSTEQLDRIDGALAEGQTRLDLIREAIERELNRRARLRSR